MKHYNIRHFFHHHGQAPAASSTNRNDTQIPGKSVTFIPGSKDMKRPPGEAIRAKVQISDGCLWAVSNPILN
jgi:hypothetical protein